MRPILRAAFLATLGGVTACEPCHLVLRCEQSPRVAVSGQILDHITGAPVSGATISLQADSGTRVIDPASSAVTGPSGAFTLEARTEHLGDVFATLTVASPGSTPFEVRDVRLRATVIAGEGAVLPPWTSARPRLPYAIELFDHATERVVSNVDVEFRRTGGARLFDPAGSEVTTRLDRTNDVGWVIPFYGHFADAADDVIGDLIVRFPDGASAVRTGLRFRALPTFAPELLLARIGIDLP